MAIRRKRSASLSLTVLSVATFNIYVQSRLRGRGATILVPYVIYFSRGWKLVERLQSLGRHHRPGAERYESVTVIDLIAGGTVDEKVLRSIDEKEDLLAALSPKRARELFE